jgi:hypothetical protein
MVRHAVAEVSMYVNAYKFHRLTMPRALRCIVSVQAMQYRCSALSDDRFCFQYFIQASQSHDDKKRKYNVEQKVMPLNYLHPPARNG